MAGFKLLTLDVADRATGAVAVGEWAYPLASVRPATPTVRAVLDDWSIAEAELTKFARDESLRAGLNAIPLSGARYCPPVSDPNAIYCAGANYKDHVAEMCKAFNLPTEPDPHEIGMPPWAFIKTPRNTMAAHGAIVNLPAYSKTVDWELEVAMVIGRVARNVSEADAMSYVAGYTIINDLSARDHLRRPKARAGSPFEYDWISHKNWDGSCPIGPWIVPRADVGNANQLSLKLWVNDVLMQDSSTAQLIYKDAELVSFLSHRNTLYPGDVIATGTPAGVGTPRGIFLKGGDTVRITVENIGTLVTHISAPSTQVAS